MLYLGQSPTPRVANKACLSGRDRAEPGRLGRLDSSSPLLYLGAVNEEQGIYRGKVLAMIGALADINAGTAEILAILRDEDDDDEEEETEP
jgi:hypothetical protein